MRTLTNIHTANAPASARPFALAERYALAH
jgi:hypothetical protein